MQDAGEPDGGGVEKTSAPSEDTTVELRKSCDYCVRLKRACDGKNPCSLCSRRHKPCTRSARKKSGPAKGTKYAPRRKRSVIAEWADRASSLGGKNPGLAPGFRGGGGGVGLGGGAHGLGGGMHGLGGGIHGLGGGAHGLGGGGGDGGGRLPHHFQGYPGEAGAAGGGRGPGMPYHGGGRFGRDVPSWREDPLAAALSGHSRGRRPSELGRRSSSTSSSALPFPMGWYGSAAHDGAEAAGGGQGGARMGEGRGLPSRLDPPPVGYAPTTAEELSRRHQLYPPSHRSAWSVSSLEMEGAGERSAVDPHRRRTWEPHPGEWGSQSNPFLRSPPQGGMGTAHGKRVRLSPPGSSRPLMRPTGAESYPEAELQPRERDMADNPAEPPRETNPDLALPFLPPPREPPDPMAGFSFHPAANRSTWRRVSHEAPWESPEGGGGRRAVGRGDPGAQQQQQQQQHEQQYAQQSSFYDPSDRPPSSWIGPSGGGGSVEYMGDRRYHGSFRAEAGAGQDRGDTAGWYPQHRGGADAYRERLEIPPPPHTFDRQRPVERPLMGGGGEGDDGGHGSMMLLGSPPRPPVSAAAAESAARDDLRSRQQMYARPSGGGGGGAAAYGRSVGRLAWPGGGVEQMNIGGRGSLDPRDHRDDDDQQMRVLERERGRLVPVPGREDWEGRYGGGEALPPPQLPPREREAGGIGGAGRGAGDPRRWESERPEAGREEDQWRGGGAGADESGRSGFLSASPSASRTGRAAQQRQREREGEEEGEQDRGVNPPASARSSAREAIAQSERPDMGADEKEDEKEGERTEHSEADSGQRHIQQGGTPTSPREPASGEGPVPKNGGTHA